VQTAKPRIECSVGAGKILTDITLKIEMLLRCRRVQEGFSSEVGMLRMYWPCLQGYRMTHQLQQPSVTIKLKSQCC